MGYTKERNWLMQHHDSLLRVITIAAVLMILAACASSPKVPTAELQAAEQAIATADRDRVTDNAAAELSDARAKLKSAYSAVEQKKMQLALYLAHESRATAELASAKSDAIKAKAINDDMQKSIDALKQEMQRKTGAQE